MKPWSGTLTVENVEDVARRIEALLTGQRYVFVSLNDGFNPDGPIGLDVDPDRELKPERGRAVTTWYGEDRTYGGFHVGDSYGVWGAMTGDAYISIDRRGLTIDHHAPIGYRLVWKVRLQRDA